MSALFNFFLVITFLFAIFWTSLLAKKSNQNYLIVFEGEGGGEFPTFLFFDPPRNTLKELPFFPPQYGRDSI